MLHQHNESDSESERERKRGADRESVDISRASSLSHNLWLSYKCCWLHQQQTVSC